MGRFVDNIIAFRILKLLTTPFEETEAYKLGIIDKKGKELKRMRDLHTDSELQAYTLLHRLVFRLKKIIERVPIDNKKIVSYAAALALIKESLEKNNEPLDLETQFLGICNEELTEELEIVSQHFLNESPMLRFRDFTNLQEEGEGAPANNSAASPGMAYSDPKLFGKRILRRNKREEKK